MAQVRCVVDCGAAGVPGDVPAAGIQWHEDILTLGQRVIQPELLCLQPRASIPCSPPLPFSFLSTFHPVADAQPVCLPSGDLPTLVISLLICQYNLPAGAGMPDAQAL